MNCIACFFATEIEAKSLIKKLKIISKIYLKSSSFLLATLNSHPYLSFLIAQTGIGNQSAKMAAQYVFDHYSVSEAWIFGLAGGTFKKTAPNTALVATQIGNIDCLKENWITTDLSLKNEAVKILSQTSQKNILGPLLTVKNVIHSSEEKISLGIDKGVIGLEMEAYPIASIAQKAKVPIMEVRFVLDEADYSLFETEKFVKESGEWSPASTFSALVQNPKIILKLPIFLKKVIQSSQELKKFLEAWLKEKIASRSMV